MNNINKIDIINNRIDNFNIHISILEKDILDNPFLDENDKIPRSEVLNDFILKKQALVNELKTLQQNQEDDII